MKPAPIAWNDLVRQATEYLERNTRCPKHHVEHTGSLAYLLDFYDHLNELEKGKAHINHLLSLIVDSSGNKVFYPGHLNPMNMSQNVIDTGAATDAIARFAHRRRNAFTDSEHVRIRDALREVAESYLCSAALEKPLTNQRLWGLTGLASYARYAGEEAKYREIAERSIERAFTDMTPDGFFRYYPDAPRYGAFIGYDGISAFYQSRCIAFIRYTLDALHIPSAPWDERLRQSEQALLSMYTAKGTKDLRMECKRWYWLSKYEVADAGFDAYALAHASVPEAQAALHNVLYQVRQHFFGGFLHSHAGHNTNFQCPIFWTAHLAWLLRVPHARETFDAASSLQDFTFRFTGKEVFTDTSPHKRILVNARFQERNPTVGIYENGLPHEFSWMFAIPALPPRLLFSLRESANHTWYALRGGHVFEALARAFLVWRELLTMLLPRYSVGYGRIELLEYVTHNHMSGLKITVRRATKYGTLLNRGKSRHIVNIDLQ